MMKLFTLRPVLLALSGLLAISVSQAQHLPSTYYFSPDGRILYQGGREDTGFYSPAMVKTISLQFPQTNYWSLLQANYSSETNLPAQLTYEGVTYDSVGVRFRGNTSYTSISTSQKKSFAIEIDWKDSSQHLLGYRNLKLNNAHQDASFMREVLYNRMANRYMPIAKGNFINLTINDQSWGIYPNVQHLDKVFLEEWFFSNDGARFRANPETGSGVGGGWGDGTAGMNYRGPDTNSYKTYYSLKSSDIDYPWSKLVTACYQLSLASAANRDSLLKYIDVDRALWYLAAENIFADDDSYVMKGKMDYMVYYEPESGRTFPFEYDGNSTFLTSAATSTSWTPFKNVTNANYPLLNKLLNIPEWRQRYLAHYRTILNDRFTPAYAHPLIDSINAQIASLVAADTKKLYTTAQYTSGVPALKTFITNRRNYLLSNTEVAQQAPVIQQLTIYNQQQQAWGSPLQGQPVQVQVKMGNTVAVQQLYLYYSNALTGVFTRVPMFDDGAHNDSLAADGIYGADIPGFSAYTRVRFYVEAIASNTARSASYFPEGAEHDVFTYVVESSATIDGVVINEFVAANGNGVRDEFNERDDWVEFYNNSSQAKNMSGWYLSDNLNNKTKWRFPNGLVLPAGGYLIVWADDSVAQGNLHASFKLSSAGEELVLSDSLENTIDQLTFGPQRQDTAWARIPNGTGSFQFRLPTHAANNDFVSSVSEKAAPALLQLYPNPTRDWLNIRTGDLESQYQVKMYDVQGRLLHQEQAVGIYQMDVQSLPAGLYLIQTEQNGLIQFKRFVKQ